MSEFFDTFASVFANLAQIDAETGMTYCAEDFLYKVRDWLNGTPPETDDPTLTLALAVIEPAIAKLKEGTE